MCVLESVAGITINDYCFYDDILGDPNECAQVIVKGVLGRFST